MNYKILAFDPQQGTITIEFEGHEAYAFNAPFINGNYLTGQTLEDYIQTLYPQVLPYESRLALIQTISGKEAILALVEPPASYVETATPIVSEQPALVVSVEPVKFTCYIGEPQEVIVTFDKPITINTFVNIMLSIPSTTTLYMPNQYDSIGPSPIKPFKITGINGETLEMYVGDTTAKYTGPVYPGGISYTQATISVKTVLNQQDRQEYITSGPIQLISESAPNA